MDFRYPVTTERPAYAPWFCLNSDINLSNSLAFYKQPKIIAFLYSRTLLLPTITDIFKEAPSLWPHTSFLTLLIGFDNIFAAFLRYAQLIIVSSLSYYVLVVNNINESCLAHLAYHSSIFQKNTTSVYAQI